MDVVLLIQIVIFIKKSLCLNCERVYFYRLMRLNSVLIVFRRGIIILRLILVFAYFILYEIYQRSEYETQNGKDYNQYYVIHLKSHPRKPAESQRQQSCRYEYYGKPFHCFGDIRELQFFTYARH